MGILNTVKDGANEVCKYAAVLTGAAGGAQAPKFMDAYAGRIGGALTESARNITSLETTARKLTGKADLDTLVDFYRQAAHATNEAAARMATVNLENVQDVVHRHDVYKGFVQAYDAASNFFERLYVTATHIDTEMLRQTWDHFTAGIDFSSDAGIAAGIGVAATLGLYFGGKKAVNSLVQRRDRKQKRLAGRRN